MELFLDSAVEEEVIFAHESGKCSGFTWNPTLVKAAVGNEDYVEYTNKISGLVGPEPHKSCEVIGRTLEEMHRAGIKIYNTFRENGNIVIKVPIFTANRDEQDLVREGLAAIESLEREGIPVNVTTIQRYEQAVLAACAGAHFISPFLGRTDDYIRTEMMGLKIGVNFDKDTCFPAEGVPHYNDGYGNVSGTHMLQRVVHALKLLAEVTGRHYDVKVLAASIRNVRQLLEAYESGADIATCPFYVFKEATEIKEWPERRVQRYSDITETDIERCLQAYETSEGLYGLLYHPKTVEGFEGFEKAGKSVPSFMRLLDTKP